MGEDGLYIMLIRLFYSAFNLILIKEMKTYLEKRMNEAVNQN